MIVDILMSISIRKLMINKKPLNADSLICQMNVQLHPFSMLFILSSTELSRLPQDRDTRRPTHFSCVGSYLLPTAPDVVCKMLSISPLTKVSMSNAENNLPQIPRQI